MKKIHLSYTNPSNSFMIRHRTETGHFNMKGCHSHKRYEIYYLVSGERYFFIKDRTYLIDKGDFVFINTYDLHKTNDTGKPDPETIIIEFNDNFLANTYHIPTEVIELLFVHHPVIKLNLNKQQYAENLLFTMVQEVKEQKLDFELCLQSILQHLLIFIGRTVQQTKVTKPQHLNPTHAKISEIVCYINQNYQDGMSLESIGSAFQINPYYLSRIFKRVTGFTFIEYLNSVRIKEAQRLLRQPKIKVITIANQVGFENQSHFGRVFKSVLGVSPMQYRKEHSK